MSAALGLQVVDEAVFALAEKQPGFAKVFFYLEQEVMKPRYEIHSIGMSEIVEPVEESKTEQRNRAARALFSATELVGANKFETEFGRTVPMTKYPEYAGRYQARFLDQVHHLAERLSRAYRDNPEKGDLTRVFARISKTSGIELLDSWGTKFRLEPVQWYRDKTHYVVRSAGPDHRFDNADDMAAYVELRSGSIVGHPDSGTITLNLEHERGPFNGLAEIAGTVTDPSGAVVPGASVTIREVSTGKTRTVAANDAGQFTLAGLPAGRYDLNVSLAGFKTASRGFTLRARDRAVLSAILSVGSVSEAVEVSAAAVIVETRNGVMKAVGGNAALVNLPMNGRDVMDFAVPQPPAAAPIDIGTSTTIAIRAKDKQEAPGPSAHVRSYFPEALYINPEIITDQDGSATITIPLADSITTWRMAMLASTTHGALGSATVEPESLSGFLRRPRSAGHAHSRRSSVYPRGRVQLLRRARRRQPEAATGGLVLAGRRCLRQVHRRRFCTRGWIAVHSRSPAHRKVQADALRPHEGRSVERADIVVREIEVIPNGREQNLVFNGRLENTVQHELNFPANSIPDASKIFVTPLSRTAQPGDRRHGQHSAHARRLL